MGRELPAGEYWYEDLVPGDRYRTGALVVTEAHIVAFAGLSGDFFDIHMDDEFARSQGFPTRVAHGLLGLALADGLKNRAGVRLMAIASLGWNYRFKGPIFAGDRIRVEIHIADKRISSKGQGIVTLGFQLAKQTGEIAQDGETTLLLRFRDGPAAS